MKNNLYRKFNLISEAIVPDNLAGLPSAEHCLIENIIGYGRGGYECDWKAINYSDSPFHRIPLIGQVRDEDVLVLALHNEDEPSNFASVLISNDSYPTFVEFVDFMPDEGYDLKTYNMLEAYTFYEVHTPLAVRSLEACHMLVGASTKLTKVFKKKYLKFIQSDIQFIKNFEKKVFKLRAEVGKENADEQFETQAVVIGLQLHTNGMHYWDLLKDHKVSDFKITGFK
jgi:hypothetical protein